MSLRVIDTLKDERLGWMAATFESVSDIVFIADLEDRFIYMNPAALKKLGYTRDEMLGKTAAMIMSPRNSKQLRAEMIKMTLDNPNGWEGEVINITKDGHEYLAHLKTAVVRNKKGKAIGMTGISRDITERIRARQELERYAKKLEEMHEILRQTQAQVVRSEKLSAIGVLAAGIAHELGNPLASISSLVQLLQRKSTDKKAEKHLASMTEHISRIGMIIHKVSDFAKEDLSELMAVDLGPLLRNTIQTVLRQRDDKRINYRISLPPDLPRIRGEAAQLFQIFSNILLNACDAINESGTVEIAAHILTDRVCVSIRDDGIGIRPRVMKRIFEPFFTTKEVGEGSGMGLAVAYGIVKRFGGDIRVESIVGKGTKFHIYLATCQQMGGANE